MANAEAAKKTKSRSPNYPGLSLEVAIEKAARIYEAERRNGAAPNLLQKHIGYTAKSGSGMVALAALKHFGLLEACGSDAGRMLKLSALALQITIDTDQNSPERIAAIKKAALTPRLYTELWNQYGKELPSDQNLKTTLVLKKNFNESTVMDVINKYKSTIEFAKLGPGDVAPSSTGELDDLSGLEVVAPSSPSPLSWTKPLRLTQEGTKDFTFPLPDGVALLRVPFPMSGESFELLRRTLEVWKDALVKKNEKESQETPK